VRKIPNREKRKKKKRSYVFSKRRKKNRKKRSDLPLPTEKKSESRTRRRKDDGAKTRCLLGRGEKLSILLSRRRGGLGSKEKEKAQRDAHQHPLFNRTYLSALQRGGKKKKKGRGNFLHTPNEQREKRSKTTIERSSSSRYHLHGDSEGEKWTFVESGRRRE